MISSSLWYDQLIRSPLFQLFRQVKSSLLRFILAGKVKARVLLPTTLVIVLLVQTPGLTQEVPPQDLVNQKPDEKPEISVKPPILNTLESLAPPDVQSLLTGSSAEVSTVPVRLDGRILFQVAAPAIENQSGEQFSLSAQQRAQEIERRLYSLLENGVTQRNLRVSQDFDQQSNQPIIRVNGEFLSTITSLDAQINGYTNPTLKAQEIVRSVEEGLEAYFREREPDYLWRQIRWSGAISILSVLMYLGLSFLRASLRRKKQRLQADFATAEAEALRHSSPDLNTSLRARLRKQEREGWIDLKRIILRISQWIVIILSVYIMVGLFPYTRWLQIVMQRLLRLPGELGLLILTTYWTIRFGNVLIDRLFLTLQDGAVRSPEPSQRLGLRFSTFSQVIKSLVIFFICLIAAIVGLGVLGVRIGPLLTGAGLVGLAISLASQSLIQDFINGFLILLEDQYGVGDVIVVGDVWGFVETMNLRMTQLRNEEGRLITIPNSKIDIVQNLSKEWSRVDLMIPIALSSDINAALKLIEQVATDMRKDTIWGQLILEPPLLLGVDHLDHAGATVRIWIKTQPLKQWDVAREYRRRLKMAFEEASIDIGIPQQVVHFGRAQQPSSNSMSFAAPATLGS
jgi:small conductance mechanosensitive channel